MQVKGVYKKMSKEFQNRDIGLNIKGNTNNKIGIIGYAAPLLGLFIMFIIISIGSPTFLTATNLLNVGRQSAVNMIIASGMTLVIFTGGIDLSVGSLKALSATTAIVLATHFGVNVWISILVCLLVGAFFGAVNGVIITKGKVPDFIATLGMLSLAKGLSLLLTDGMPVPDFKLAVVEVPQEIISLGSGQFFWIPAPLIIALFVVFTAWFLSKNSHIGRYLFAVGGNREAARVSGISVEKTKIIAYSISGLFAAVAGIVLSGRLGSANALMGTGAELTAIAAVVMGGTNLFGGEGSLGGTLIGAVTIAVLNNGLNLLAVSSFWQQVIMGAVIIAVVVFDQWRRRRFASAK